MEFKRIRVITPVTGEALGNAEFARRLGDAATEVDLVQIERGPASIECEFEHAMAVPDTLRLIVDAEREGVAAVVVDCMADPGVRPGRELVRIPVVGPAEASMHLACQLGHRFSIVTTEARSVPEFENQARAAGLAERLASVRWVDIPVLDLASEPKALLSAPLIDESVSAIEADGAHVIVFGCTGMLGFAEGVRDGLVARGYSGRSRPRPRARRGQDGAGPPRLRADPQRAHVAVGAGEADRWVWVPGRCARRQPHRRRGVIGEAEDGSSRLDVLEDPSSSAPPSQQTTRRTDLAPSSRTVPAATTYGLLDRVFDGQARRCAATLPAAAYEIEIPARGCASTWYLKLVNL